MYTDCNTMDDTSRDRPTRLNGHAACSFADNEPDLGIKVSDIYGKLTT